MRTAPDNSIHQSRSSRPRIVFLGHGAERTGPPILLGHLLRGLVATRPWELSVLVARCGPLLDDYRGCTVRATAVSKGREPLEPLSAGLRRLNLETAATWAQGRSRSHAAKSFAAADLVYVNSATPATAALLRALNPPVTTPVVLHVHELGIGLHQNLSEADRRLLFDRADQVIAASGPVADLLVGEHGIRRERLSTCEEFVDVGALRPLPRAEARRRIGVPPEAEVVGSVGIPDWRKDPDHLLRALALLADRPGGSPWAVWIGGYPTSSDGMRLACEARRLGLADRIVHVAHQDDPAALLHALDVFALPAREDAMPLAALEAAAVGLPLVCFRTGGIAALCDAGAGRAVEYPDTSGFASAIAAMLDDPERRAAAGATARSLVLERNDLAVGVERIAAVLNPLLEG